MDWFLYLLLGLFLILIGLIGVFFGARLYKLLLPLMGAVAGFGVGAMLMLLMTGNQFAAWIGGLVLGLIGALLAALLWKVSVAWQFFSAGYLLTTWFLAWLGLSTTGNFGFLAILMGGVAAVALVVFAIRYEAWHYTLAISTAFNGSLIILYGFLFAIYQRNYLQSGSPDFAGLGIPGWLSLLYAVGVIALGLLGSYYQIQNDPDIDENLRKLGKAGNVRTV